MEKKQSRSFYIEDGVYTKIVKIAKAKKWSKSQVINEELKKALDKKQKGN